jgi:hypothetical protein
MGEGGIRAYNGGVKDLLERLNGIGYERTRRAVAALALSLFVFLYLLISLNPPSDEWRLAFLAMSACYGVAFMGVAAEWFWGRWFAAGLGYSGMMVAVASFTMIGWSPVLAIYGALHALVVVTLAGKKMAERFEMQPAWRERYGMDEFGVARLKKTVTRASASLPSVILWALAPKEPGQGLFAAATLVTGVLALAGLVGVVRLRSWGLLALAGAAVALFAGGASAFPHFDVALSDHVFNGVALSSWFPLWEGSFRNLLVGPALPVLLLGAAVLPFVRPAVRFVTARR